MADNKKCCVCGKESNITMFSTGHNLLNYCEYCASNYLENYNEMVNIGMLSYELSPSYKQKTLIPSLAYYKKTLEDFDRDVLSFLNDSEDEDDKDE